MCEREAMSSTLSAPDAIAKNASHVVGAISTLVASYVLKTLFGVRRPTAGSRLLLAGGAVWIHAELDLPVAKKLAELGL
jgi:hypothetical protein